MIKKKILFVTTRSPFSSIFSGDRQRANAVINNLSKTHKIDVLYSDVLSNEKIRNKNIKRIFFERSLIEKIKKIFICLFSLKPLQLGYFYSDKVNNFLKENHKNYDAIVFHLIRAAQYLPSDFKGTKILEMTDIVSKRYTQIVNSFSIFNPLMYLYLLEESLVKNYENYCINTFDKIILASKKDLKDTKIKNNKKFIEIPNTVKLNKYIYNYQNSNNKILFIGNINYIPNKEACKKFAKKILPRIINTYPNIEFHIVGEIKKTDKILFQNFKNTYAHGPKKKLENFIKNSICGVCNLSIATGTQMKILTYASYGLPCVSSDLSFKSTFFKKGKEILVYKNINEFILLVKKLKTNKSFSKKVSKNSYLSFKKKYKESKIFSSYKNII